MTKQRNENAKKALAAGALGLGVAGASAISGGSRNAIAQQPNQALVFGYEYNPGIEFRVEALLQQGTVNTILGRQVGDDGSPIVQNTDDYTGYVIRYQPDQDAGEYAFVFVRDGTLQTGERYEFGTDATFFNSQANLVTAGLAAGEAEETTPEEEETTPEEETTTPAEEETTTTTTEETTPEETEEVVVETTTTTENGGGG